MKTKINWTAIYVLGWPIAIFPAVLLRHNLIDLSVALSVIFVGMSMVAIGLLKNANQ